MVSRTTSMALLAALILTAFSTSAYAQGEDPDPTPGLDDVTGLAPLDEEQEALVGEVGSEVTGTSGTVGSTAQAQHDDAVAFATFLDSAKAEGYGPSDCSGADRSNIYIDAFCTIVETIDQTAEENGPRAYTESGDSASDAYYGVVAEGICIACYQAATDRFAINAGPAVHGDENGAAGTQGMLVANDGGISFDLDTISAFGSEDEDSILEHRDADGAYLDNTPTLMLSDIAAMRFLTTDPGYPDGEPLDMSFVHIKWSGNRDEIFDPTGPYSKYSNLDDDAYTDLQEAMCPGQVTNPTNPDAHCDDWDADGIDNQADSEPRSPRESIAISFSASSPVNAASDSAEAPVDPLFDLTCEGVGSVYMQISLDGGSTWTDREDDSFPLLASDDDVIAIGDCEDHQDISLDEFLNPRATDQEVQVRAFIHDTYSNVLSFTVRGNAAPSVESVVVACSDSNSDACAGDGHKNYNGVQHTFTVSGIDPKESNQDIEKVFIAVDGYDHDPDKNGVQNLELSRSGDDWAGSFSYPEDADYTFHAIVIDTGAASTSTGDQTFHIFAPQPCSGPLSPYVCTEDLVIPVDPLEIAEGLVGLANDTINDVLGRADETADELEGTATEVAEGTLEQANKTAQEVVATPDQVITHVKSLQAWLEQAAADNVSAAQGLADETVEWVLDKPSELIYTIPDASEYIIGDCVLLGDLIAVATAVASEGDPIEALCPQSVGESGLPGDEIDFRDVDDDDSNDGQPNGQIDLIEMFVAYHENQGGRTTLHVLEPARGVTPHDDEQMRVSAGDDSRTAVKERLVIDDGTLVVCLHEGTSGDGTLRVGQGASEEEACGQSVSAVSQLSDQGIGEQLGIMLGFDEPRPLFSTEDADNDNVPDYLSVHLPDLTSCELDPDHEAVDPEAASPDDPFAAYSDGGITCAGHFLVEQTIHVEGLLGDGSDDDPSDDGGNDTSEGSDPSVPDDPEEIPEEAGLPPDEEGVQEAPDRAEEAAEEAGDEAGERINDGVCGDGTVTICVTDKEGLLTQLFDAGFGIKVRVGPLSGPRL